MKSSTGGERKGSHTLRKGSHTLKDQYEFLGQEVLEMYLTVELDLTRWSVCKGLVMEGTAGCLRKQRWCVSLGSGSQGGRTAVRCCSYSKGTEMLKGSDMGARWGLI